MAKNLNLIGEGTIIEGKLKSAGSVRIDGRFVGEINAQDAVAVGKSGDVEGNVTAKNITIGGKVRGSLVAQEKLIFEGQAVVRGDIRTTKLVIDEGALFDGKCSMTGTETAELMKQGAGEISPARRDVKPTLGTLEQKR